MAQRLRKSAVCINSEALQSSCSFFDKYVSWRLISNTIFNTFTQVVLLVLSNQNIFKTFLVLGSVLGGVWNCLGRSNIYTKKGQRWEMIPFKV